MNVKRLRTCLFTMNVKRLTFIKMNKYLLPTEAVPSRRSSGADGKRTAQKKVQGDSFVLKEQGKWQNRDFADLLKGFNIWRVTCSTLSQQYGQGTFTQTRAEHRPAGVMNRRGRWQPYPWRAETLVRKVKHSNNVSAMLLKQLTYQDK